MPRSVEGIRVKRLYSLDALRGIAALSVVIWHWQHFFAISGAWQVGWRRDSQPLFWLLKPLYEQGWIAVDLFFALSGFVFFWLYGEAIRERRMAPVRFALLRFSRLYPLHFATLIFVAVLQTFFFRATGKFFIFDANDWQHFIPNLFLSQQWLPPTIDQSFNGPAWSVSIETLLYGVFFLFCRLGLKASWWRIAIPLAAIFLLQWNEFIARGLMGFFLGGLVLQASEAIKARANAKQIAIAMAWLTLPMWGCVFASFYVAAFGDAGSWLMACAPFGIAHWGADDIYEFFLCGFIFVVSPLTILALALDEQVLGGRYSGLSFLGDISYSTYMIHFPMQLTLALVALKFGWTPKSFQSVGALAAFYVVLIALGFVSYHVFERPMQNLIRKHTRERVPAAAE
jgi:peptidoglycan/LPS O-acetylase OafA/YrhL